MNEYKWIVCSELFRGCIDEIQGALPPSNIAVNRLVNWSRHQLWELGPSLPKVWFPVALQWIQVTSAYPIHPLHSCWVWGTGTSAVQARFQFWLLPFPAVRFWVSHITFVCFSIIMKFSWWNAEKKKDPLNCLRIIWEVDLKHWTKSLKYEKCSWSSGDCLHHHYHRSYCHCR